MSSKDVTRPEFSPEEALQIGKMYFNIEGQIAELPSERDRNFHIKELDGKEYVLKIAAKSEEREILELQNRAMIYLAKKQIPLKIPHLIENTDEELISTVKDRNGTPHFVRMVTYLPGTELGNFSPHSEAVLYTLGKDLGSLSDALADFEDPNAMRDFYWDLSNAPRIIKEYLHLIDDNEKQELIKYFLALYEAQVSPKLYGLPMSVIHNDANDYNIIVQGGLSPPPLFGILDFGDMVYSYSVSEIAIAAAYIALGKEQPLSSVCALLRGYCEKFTLSASEVDVLFVLLCMRLAMSVCIAAYQCSFEPDNEYLRISQEPAWVTLAKLRETNSRYATYLLRDACDFEPDCKNPDVRKWLIENRDEISKLIDIDFSSDKVQSIDVSVGSLEIENPEELDSLESSEVILERFKKANALEVLLGRYDEPRLVYSDEQFIETSDEGSQSRTVHLGLDFFMPPGTPIYAPLDGEVHSFQENELSHDYGPTIILKHTVSDSVEFYTLYGHLSRSSLEGLKIGGAVVRGQKFAEIGSKFENGGWPTHLHFQLITDVLDYLGDYPGACLASQRRVWRSLSPDPNLIAKIPEEKLRDDSLEKGQILSVREQHLGESLSISYQKPLKIVRGFMQYLYDETGRRYLDGVNNVPHVGHSNPAVVKAIQRQVAVLNTNTRYLHDTLVKFIERLLSKFTEPLNVCYLVNSGSEANELALRLAYTHTNQEHLVCLDGAYHGNTKNLIDISPYKHDGPGGKGTPPHVRKVIMPDPYRGPYKRDDTRAGEKYASEVQTVIEDIRNAGHGVAAFISEPLLGCGGQIIPPNDFLKHAYSHVRKVGGVCIADEVQIGFGRVGTHFWGFETQNATPDIVTLGKPIGNGHPLAAVVTTKEIAESFANGMEYFSTTGGNPVSCAAGLAVLDVIEGENLQQRALEVGGYLMNGLRDLSRRFSLIGDVRGKGLFIGIELVRDHDTLEAADAEATYIIERMKDLGILLSTDGPLHNVIKIKPPLVFSKENSDSLIRALERILQENPLHQ